MTTSALPLTKNRGLLSGLMLIGFIAAMSLRLLVGGHNVAQSQPAGLVFAICLYSLVLATGTRVAISRRSIIIGLAGGLFLCLPAAWLAISAKYIGHPGGNYLGWALVVSIVAFAEEAFLRGALFDIIKKQYGQNLAILIPALAFAALHIPLYGWHVLPLDLAVGLWLGALRVASGSFVAPGIAHTIADLVGWWL